MLYPKCQTRKNSPFNKEFNTAIAPTPPLAASLMIAKHSPGWRVGEGAQRGQTSVTR